MVDFLGILLKFKLAFNLIQVDCKHTVVLDSGAAMKHKRWEIYNEKYDLEKFPRTFHPIDYLTDCK